METTDEQRRRAYLRQVEAAADTAEHQRKMREEEIWSFIACGSLFFLLPQLLRFGSLIGQARVASQLFHPTRCQVLEITTPIIGDCSEVVVRYRDQKHGGDFTKLLHLDETRLSNTCIPASFLPNCTDFDLSETSLHEANPRVYFKNPRESCYIVCLYDPLNPVQVIEHTKIGLSEMLEPAEYILITVGIEAMLMDVIPPIWNYFQHL